MVSVINRSKEREAALDAVLLLSKNDKQVNGIHFSLLSCTVSLTTMVLRLYSYCSPHCIPRLLSVAKLCGGSVSMMTLQTANVVVQSCEAPSVEPANGGNWLMD